VTIPAVSLPLPGPQAHPSPAGRGRLLISRR
jgi:hypothetical protein